MDRWDKMPKKKKKAAPKYRTRRSERTEDTSADDFFDGKFTRVKKFTGRAVPRVRSAGPKTRGKLMSASKGTAYVHGKYDEYDVPSHDIKQQGRVRKSKQVLVRKDTSSSRIPKTHSNGSKMSKPKSHTASATGNKRFPTHNKKSSTIKDYMKRK